MVKGNIFVLKMIKERYNQILDVEDSLLQDPFIHSHIHYTLCNISLTTNHSLFASYTRLESNNIKVLSWTVSHIVQVAFFYIPNEY